MCIRDRDYNLVQKQQQQTREYVNLILDKMKDMVDFGVSVKTAADINQLIRNRKKWIECMNYREIAFLSR